MEEGHRTISRLDRDFPNLYHAHSIPGQRNLPSESRKTLEMTLNASTQMFML